MIDEVLRRPYDDVEHDYLWLADSYDNLVELPEGCDVRRHRPQVDAQWRSPFVGRTIREAAEFVRNAPKPPKALNKVHFVILEKAQYEDNGWLTVCKVVDEEVQSLACVAESVSSFLSGYDRDTLDESLRIWEAKGIPVMK